MAQLSFLDDLDPPPAAPIWTPEPERTVMTRAYGCDYEMTLRGDAQEPFELEVRGIRCLITSGLCTYTLDGPGSPFWSETGFRSFGQSNVDPEEVREIIERYIDAPTKHGNGCGGKLTRWWPMWALQWAQSRERDFNWNRDEVWTQWGPEKHAECWANHDADQLAAIIRMKAEGIDPNDVLASHRPKQPAVTMMELQTGLAK